MFIKRFLVVIVFALMLLVGSTPAQAQGVSYSYIPLVYPNISGFNTQIFVYNGADVSRTTYLDLYNRYGSLVYSASKVVVARVWGIWDTRDFSAQPNYGSGVSGYVHWSAAGEDYKVEVRLFSDTTDEQYSANQTGDTNALSPIFYNNYFGYNTSYVVMNVSGVTVDISATIHWQGGGTTTVWHTGIAPMTSTVFGLWGGDSLPSGFGGIVSNAVGAGAWQNVVAMSSTISPTHGRMSSSSAPANANGNRMVFVAKRYKGFRSVVVCQNTSFTSQTVSSFYAILDDSLSGYPYQYSGSASGALGFGDIYLFNVDGEGNLPYNYAYGFNHFSSTGVSNCTTISDRNLPPYDGDTFQYLTSVSAYDVLHNPTVVDKAVTNWDVPEPSNRWAETKLNFPVGQVTNAIIQQDANLVEEIRPYEVGRSAPCAWIEEAGGGRLVDDAGCRTWISAHPHKYWIVGNEPDNTPYQCGDPHCYRYMVQWWYLSALIRERDSSAKVGVTSWTRVELPDDPSYFYLGEHEGDWIRNYSVAGQTVIDADFWAMHIYENADHPGDSGCAENNYTGATRVMDNISAFGDHLREQLYAGKISKYPKIMVTETSWRWECTPESSARSFQYMRHFLPMIPLYSQVMRWTWWGMNDVSGNNGALWKNGNLTNAGTCYMGADYVGGIYPIQCP